MERSTTTFRKLLGKKDLIVVPGAYDAFTARLIESLGFPAVYAGGNATGTHLNIPEPFLSLTDMLEQSSRINHVIDIPLIVDAGVGFGDGVHVYRTVREFERVGVAGIHIEDQVYPKRVDYHRRTDKGGMGATYVIPLSDMLDKLKVALDARRDPDFVIIGRTDALCSPGGLDETLERCHAYKEVGVDVIFVAGQPNPEQGRTIGQAIKDIPMMWLGGGGIDDLPTLEVAAMGYQLMVYAVTGQVLVADAFLSAFSHVRDHGTLGIDLDHILATRQQVMSVLGMPEYWEVDAPATKQIKVAG